MGNTHALFCFLYLLPAVLHLNGFDMQYTLKLVSVDICIEFLVTGFPLCFSPIDHLVCTNQFVMSTI